MGTARPRAGCGRLAPAEGGLRAVRRQVLRSLATTGHPPAPARGAETAARHGTTAGAVLALLHVADFLELGPSGDIRAAYPFSAVPTQHAVSIAGGLLRAAHLIWARRLPYCRTDRDPRRGGVLRVRELLHHPRERCRLGKRPPGVTGQLLGQTVALRLGVIIFGHLLASARCAAVRKGRRPAQWG